MVNLRRLGRGIYSAGLDRVDRIGTAGACCRMMVGTKHERMRKGEEGCRGKGGHERRTVGVRELIPVRAWMRRVAPQSQGWARSDGLEGFQGAVEDRRRKGVKGD